MGRSRDRSILEDLFDLLTDAPVWMGPVVAGVVYAGFRWGLPTLFPGGSTNQVGVMLSRIAGPTTLMIAPWAGSAVLLVWVAAELKKRSRRRRLDSQTGIESIQNLSWAEFEALLGEAYRRQGYQVDHCGRAGPDGGVDLRLERGGITTLVQCKQWRSRQVGVKVVRELLGVMTQERAANGVVVTSGSFTPDAVEFARGQRIDLIDGSTLAGMIRGVQSSPPSPPDDVTKPTCQRCGSQMNLQTAKRGANVGSKFWGCSRFPACRGTRSI